MTQKLRQLADLAAMVKEAKLTDLSVAEKARRECTKQADTLRRARETSQNQAKPDPAHLSGNADVWEVWSAERLNSLAAEEANAAAAVEVAKRAAARAFGRASVLERIFKEQRRNENSSLD